jgi:hypothetical protein
MREREPRHLAQSESPSLSGAQFARWADDVGFDELRHILLWRWDPIGIVDSFPNTADEYDRYACALLTRLGDNVTSSEIAAYLGDVEKSRMFFGRQHSADADLRALSERILAWYGRSISRWLQPGRL